MTQYQLTSENFVYRFRDGVRTTIPLVDPGPALPPNPDAIEYRAWLAAGGVPLPAELRPAAEIAAVAAGNPFPHAAGNRVVALFVDEALPTDPLTGVTGLRDEQLVLGTREIFVHYGDGMADSRLRIPYAQQGTARNLNTVGKLAAMAAALGQVTSGGRGRR